MQEAAQPQKRHWKAYSTVAGGFIYFMWAGSLYCTSQIAPYIASYYQVPVARTQFVFPS
jgi:hypothetical protein